MCHISHRLSIHWHVCLFITLWCVGLLNQGSKCFLEHSCYAINCAKVVLVLYLEVTLYVELFCMLNCAYVWYKCLFTGALSEILQCSEARFCLLVTKSTTNLFDTRSMYKHTAPNSYYHVPFVCLISSRNSKTIDYLVWNTGQRKQRNDLFLKEILTPSLNLTVWQQTNMFCVYFDHL